MTEQFHEGQEVYVAYQNGNLRQSAEAWRKAKIVECEVDYYLVQFPDGTRATFDEAHIRASQMECSYDHGSGGSGRLWP